MDIKWTEKITNEELWRITHHKSIENQIKRRKWNWIGHTLCKGTGAIEKTALDWNPQGCRRRGRPKRTWRRTTEDDIRRTRRSWNKVKGIAGDRNAWKLFMDALCSTRSKRIWWWYAQKVTCPCGLTCTRGRVLSQSMKLSTNIHLQHDAYISYNHRHLQTQKVKNKCETPQTAGTQCKLHCSAHHYVDVTPFLATSRFSTGCFLM